LTGKDLKNKYTSGGCLIDFHNLQEFFFYRNIGCVRTGVKSKAEVFLFLTGTESETQPYKTSGVNGAQGQEY